YVTVHCDEAGREAQLFHAETSGDTVLYDAKGNLLFHGGMTISRGHSGDNPGRSLLQTLVLDQSAQQTQNPVLHTPVISCSHLDTTCTCAEPSYHRRCANAALGVADPPYRGPHRDALSRFWFARVFGLLSGLASPHLGDPGCGA